jgi:hypothetical protein
MSVSYSPATANKFPKMQQHGKTSKVRGVSQPSPQFSQLSDVKVAKGGSKSNSAQPRVGYQRAECY